jgi:hypothetical protein
MELIIFRSFSKIFLKYKIDLQTLKNQLESESKRLEAENLRRAQEADEMRLKLEKEKADLAR